MRPALLTLLACLLASPVSADTGEIAEQPKLHLIAEDWTVQVGENITLYLAFEIPDSVGIIADERLTESPYHFSGRSPFDGLSMELSMRFTPKEAGFEQFGPFELPLGDRTLISNAVEVQVFPDWEPGETGYRWQLSHEEVQVGQPFGLTVRQRVIGEGPDIQFLQVAKRYRGSNAAVKVKGAGSSAYSGTVYETASVRTFHSKFIITPTQPGELQITREFFENLPEGIEPPDLFIDVLEELAE